jgi:hypothetical protein
MMFFLSAGSWQGFASSFCLWMTAVTQLPGSGPGESAGAGSPFTTYMAGVAIYSLIIGALVTILLGAGLLIVNLGLLSKRPEDRTGGRNPSDLGILKSNTWPEAPYEQNLLPAEESPEVVEEAKEEDLKRPAA